MSGPHLKKEIGIRFIVYVSAPDSVNMPMVWGVALYIILSQKEIGSLT